MALAIFLRGVNVGGHRTFRPSVLAKELDKYGAINIGAAGTFIVRKAVTQACLRLELLRRLPFEAEIIICNAQELIAAVAANPFEACPQRSDIVRFVSILAKRPRTLPAIPMRVPNDKNWLLTVVAAHGRFVFGFYRREMKAIGALGRLDKLFGAPVTTRNWNTISALVTLLAKHKANCH